MSGTLIKPIPPVSSTEVTQIIQEITNVSNFLTEVTQQNITNVSNYYSEVNEATGFINATDSQITFNNDTRTFTISPVVSSFSFWAFGTRYTKLIAETVVIDDVTGLWYIYYTAAGVIGASQSIWDLSTQVPVASVYWESNTGTVEPIPEPVPKPTKFDYLYTIAAGVSGKLTAAQLVLFHPVVGSEKVLLNKRLPYSYIVCDVAPTLTATFNIYVNGVQKGTGVISAGQTSGVFTWTNIVNLAGGNIVKITGPDTADATLSGVGITIKGERY